MIVAAIVAAVVSALLALHLYFGARKQREFDRRWNERNGK